MEKSYALTLHSERSGLGKFREHATLPANIMDVMKHVWESGPSSCSFLI